MAILNLAWDAVSGATSYEVFRSNTTGGPYARIGTSLTTAYSDTGLPGSTAFFYVVRAVNANGTSAFSSEATATTLNVPGTPAAPTVATGDATFTPTWVAPSTGGSAITGYRVTLKNASTLVQVAQTTVGNVLTHTFTGLANGTAYVASVAAINSQGTGPDSPNSASGTPSTVPDAPRNVSAAAGAASATVSWTPPFSNGGSAITGYRVTPFIGATAQTTTSVGNVTSASVTGLTNGTAYTFKVEAQNTRGFSVLSAASNSVTPTAATVPDAPSIASVVAGNANATLTVTAPANNGGATITHYRITPFISGTAQTATEFAVASSYTVTGLTNGTAYTFKAAARNSVGYGADSTASSAVTPTAAGKTATFVVANTTLSTGDAVVKTELETLGYTVTTVLDTAAEDATARTIVVISESCISTNIGSKYRDLTIPAINMEAFAWDDWDAIPASATWQSVDMWAYVFSSHAANGGLSIGWHQFSVGGEHWETQDTGLPAAATRTLTGDNTGDFVRGLAFEQGDAMLNSRTAQRRRLFLPWKESMWASGLTADGRTLFQAHVNWASGGTTAVTKPDPPTNVTATAADASASLRWTAPYSGGSPITGYQVTPFIGAAAQTPVNVGNVTATTIGSLTNGTTYTFTVKATNAIGTSDASAASNAVTPSAQTTGSYPQSIGVNHEGVQLLRSSWPRYGMVYANPWFKEYVAEVKAANPNCLVGGYRCAASFRPGLFEDRLGRITYATGWDRDPPDSWYINGTGPDTAFQWRYFPGLYFADLEQSQVRQAWVDDTLDWAAWGGFDAIFLDNATYRNVGPFGYGEPAGWSQARYKAAMLDHLANLGPAMHNAGVHVFCNLGSSDMSAAEAGEHLDSGSDDGAAFRFHGSFEYWAHFDGAADRWDPYWISQGMAYADEAASRGLGFLPLASHVAQTATTTKRLARAMQLMTMSANKPNFLLIYDGSTFYPPDNDFAVEIGVPLAARYAVGNGLRRDFSGGVCVMTHTNASQTFALGANYRTPDGAITNSVTLAGTSGMALSTP